MPINPTQQAIEALAAEAGQEADGPLVMLNLNRYRSRAAYEGDPPGGASPDVSGREAYARYLEVAQRVGEREGAGLFWHAASRGTVIGDPEDRYDEVIAVSYPSVAAFLALALDPEILDAMAHRTAGLERATLIRFDVQDDGGEGLDSISSIR